MYDIVSSFRCPNKTVIRCRAYVISDGCRTCKHFNTIAHYNFTLFIPFSIYSADVVQKRWL